jgi:hypothetical protein
MENIFNHEGMPGREVVLFAEFDVPESEFKAQRSV